MLFQAEKQGISLNPCKKPEPELAATAAHGLLRPPAKRVDKKTVDFLYAIQYDWPANNSRAQGADGRTGGARSGKIKPRADITRSGGGFLLNNIR